MTRPAIVLTSGGLDSTTCLAIALAEGFEPVAVTFAYGQRHAAELEAARRVARHYAVGRHLLLELELFRELGGSALTDDIEVPEHERVEELEPGVPVTYVPARNLVFLSHAVAVAEALGARDVFLGVNALDYSGYPDCRPEFVLAFERAANLATRVGTEAGAPLAIRTPLLHLTKGEIVRRAVELGAPLHLTHSCYAPQGALSCGRCDACLLRRKGFAEAGLEDPIAYADARAKR